MLDQAADILVGPPSRRRRLAFGVIGAGMILIAESLFGLAGAGIALVVVGVLIGTWPRWLAEQKWDRSLWLLLGFVAGIFAIVGFGVARKLSPSSPGGPTFSEFVEQNHLRLAIALGIILLVPVGAWLAARFRRRQRREDLSPSPPEYARSDAVEALREIFPGWKDLFNSTLTLFLNDLRSLERDGGARSLAYETIGDCYMKPFRGAVEDWCKSVRKHAKGNLSLEDHRLLIGKFKCALSGYNLFRGELERLMRVSLVANQARSLGRYREIVRLHDQCVERLEIRANRGDDLGTLKGEVPDEEWPEPLTAEQAVAEFKRFTTDGLNWEVRDHEQIGGKAVAKLRVRSTGELPQPLELNVTCAGSLKRPSARFVPDPVRPAEVDQGAEVEIHDPAGAESFKLKLLAPKLHPPAYLDIILRSEGNARIKVEEVRRTLGVGEKSGGGDE